MEIKLNEVCSNNLENINITFLENEITALIGANNGGKIELLNLLYGLQLLKSGNIKYGRKKIDEKSNSKKIDEIRNDVFYLNSGYKKMLFNINIKEDIKFYLGKYKTHELEDILRNFNLNKNILSKNYIDLSSSEYKKILLIMALLVESKIIILSDPTSTLDYKSIQTLIKYLKKLKRENKIIIINSNNIDFLLEISDKVIVIDNKNIVAEGAKFDVLSNEQLLKSINIKVPYVLDFSNKVKQLKNIKIGYRDNESDLLKDIFRNAK